MALVRTLKLPVADADLNALADILVDCVEGGASIGFVRPFTVERARAFWQQVVGSIGKGRRTLLVAEDAGTVVGTAQVVFAQADNQPHRADIAKVLVPRHARRRGIGEQLMRAAEDAARAAGRTLLVLDTATPEAEQLYRRLGWTEVGRIPKYALRPDGTPCATTLFFKELPGVL